VATFDKDSSEIEYPADAKKVRDCESRSDIESFIETHPIVGLSSDDKLKRADLTRVDGGSRAVALRLTDRTGCVCLKAPDAAITDPANGSVDDKDKETPKCDEDPTGDDTSTGREPVNIVESRNFPLTARTFVAVRESDGESATASVGERVSVSEGEGASLSVRVCFLVATGEGDLL
jgi:hypothetical protein